VWTALALLAALPAAERVQLDLPSGDGRSELVDRCASCHELQTVVAKRRTRQQWHATILDMRDKGAAVSELDAQAIETYLTRHFGMVDVNAAPADELEAVLGITRRQAEAIVAYRRTHPPFSRLDDLEGIVELDAKEIARWKDRVVFKSP
jgi:competence ComEA-like helix-hairpin-helix protein